MPDMLYVGLQDDDKIAVFALDGDSGELTKPNFDHFLAEASEKT